MTSFDRFRLIPLCTAHEIRRDFPDLIAEATPAGPVGSPDELWGGLPALHLDLLFDPEAREHATFVERLRRAGGAADGAMLVTRSALLEVSREMPADDRCGRNLRHLLDGWALRVFDHVILALDDRLSPCLGVAGGHADLLPLLDRLRRLADETLPVLVCGETGTGKELVARGLHDLGRRRGRPWMAINCAELPEGILESELFGHARGAFTGAFADRAGLFEAAGEGTAFLDEVGELPPAAQAKLLRLLEEHCVRRIGSSQSRILRCRVVAATNRELAHEIRDGRFRSDLFYRLRGAEVRLPPLRDRAGDILPLAERFLARARLRFRRSLLGFTEEAKLALLSHSWPGNVRELRQVVDSAALAAEERWIRLGDLSLLGLREPPAVLPLRTVRAVERDTILRALEETAGNKVAAARLLGLTRQSLQRRIERHRILVTGNGRVRPEPVARFGHSAIVPPRNSGRFR